MAMTKDELVAHAKKVFGVTLSKKLKLADIKARVATLEESSEPDEWVNPELSSNNGDPIAVRGANGTIFPWNSGFREDAWVFIYDKDALSKAEKKLVGV